MNDNLLDKKTLNIVQTKTENGNHSSKNSRSKRNLAHFLIDFNVISSSISFLIALETHSFIRIILDNIIDNCIFLENKIIKSFISLFLVFTISFLFVSNIFYNYIYTDDVAKENILKKAINEKKKDVAKESVENDPKTINQIEKISELQNVKEYYNNYDYNYLYY